MFGDGIVGADDGSLLIAQDNNSQVLKLENRRDHFGCVFEYPNRGLDLHQQERCNVSWSRGALRSAIVQMAPVRRNPRE